MKYSAKNLELCVPTLFTVHAANGIIVVAQLARRWVRNFITSRGFKSRYGFFELMQQFSHVFLSKFISFVKLLNFLGNKASIMFRGHIFIILDNRWSTLIETLQKDGMVSSIFACLMYNTLSNLYFEAI